MEAFGGSAGTSELGIVFVSDPSSESRSSIAISVPSASSSAFTAETECIRVCLLIRGVEFDCFKDVRDSSEPLDLDSTSFPCFSLPMGIVGSIS